MKKCCKRHRISRKTKPALVYPLPSEFCNYLLKGTWRARSQWSGLDWACQNLHTSAKPSKWGQNNRLAIVICTEVLIVHKPSIYINLNGLCGQYKKQARQPYAFNFLNAAKRAFWRSAFRLFPLTFNSSTFQSHPKLFDSYKLYLGRFIFQASVETIGSSSWQICRI